MTERFELLEQLGRGGMGTVWKARDTETGEIVALKLLHQMYVDDPDYVARFEREVELAKRIVSPFVVRTIGFGKRDGTPYVVMEHVGGGSLRDRIKAQGPVGWEEAKRIAIQLATALAAAHAAGVIHRDIKPSNVLIDEDGNVKLADFGIARANDLTRMTGSVTVLGTPAYMSPDSEPSPQSDLYALGCVLYELMKGVPPFEGDSQQQVLIRHIREAPKLEGLPGESAKYVEWLLRKSPGDRPRSATAFLESLHDSTAIPASPPVVRVVATVPGTVPDQSRRRNRVVTVVLGIVGLSGLAAALLIALLARQGGDEERVQPGWAIVATEIAAYVPKAGEHQPAMNLGPFLYGPDFLVISFKVRPQCGAGQSEMTWAPDVATANVILRTKDGNQILATSGWGLASGTGRLQCGVEYVGSWFFAGQDSSGLTLEYSRPAFKVPIPDRERGSHQTPLTLILSQKFTVNTEAVVSSTSCLASFIVPAPGAPTGECFAPREHLTITGGPIDNIKRWWEVTADDGVRGWVEQENAASALTSPP